MSNTLGNKEVFEVLLCVRHTRVLFNKYTNEWMDKTKSLETLGYKKWGLICWVKVDFKGPQISSFMNP